MISEKKLDSIKAKPRTVEVLARDAQIINALDMICKTLQSIDNKLSKGGK